MSGVLQANNMGGRHAGFEGVYLIDDSSVGDGRGREDGEYRNIHMRVLLPAELDCSTDGVRSGQRRHGGDLRCQLRERLGEMRNIGGYILPKLLSIADAGLE